MRKSVFARWSAACLLLALLSWSASPALAQRTPEEAAKAMTVPEGFHVSLFAGEPDVQQPIAMAFDDRGRLWVAEDYSYPTRVPEKDAKDRILIFEDTDGDGKFDTRKVFYEGLNLVTGIEIGFGGVWVGAAPYFYFIPDKDGDDKPDGPPQVILDGWAWQDTHETLNTFHWGPDGWLYGCHGVFTHSLVGKPDMEDEERVPLNAALWRYHPVKDKFEVFAHGTSNPWGVDWNDRGQAFITACVIPHLYHVIQGARYQRQAGAHFNPYTYDDIKTIAVHRHWIGETPHSGNGRSDAAGGGHAHSGAMIYLGGVWPERYKNQIIMNNIHGNRLNEDLLYRKGSGYEGNRSPDFLLANDGWSQILNMAYGPDGQMYMIDWYDHQACHTNDIKRHDRSNGRVFKVSYGESKKVHVDMKAKTDAELVADMKNPNAWYGRHAQRILQERAAAGKLDKATHGLLEKLVFEQNDEPLQLKGLWGLHVTGGLNDRVALKAMESKNEFTRAWPVQLILEEAKPVSQEVYAKFVELAEKDPSQVVRLYLASALQRLPVEQRWGVAEKLLQHAEDATDHNLPLMYWYGVEPLAVADTDRALGLAQSSKIELVSQFLVRRIAAIGTPESIAQLVSAVGKADNTQRRLLFLGGINEALAGQRDIQMPASWKNVAAALYDSSDVGVRTEGLLLGLKFGDATARDRLDGFVLDRKANPDLRRAAIRALVSAKDKGVATKLQQLIDDPEVASVAILGLSSYGDSRTPALLINAYSKLAPAERRDVLTTLAGRLEWSNKLLDAVQTKRIQPSELSADIVRQMQELKNPQLDQRIEKLWGKATTSPADKQKLVKELKRIVGKLPQSEADLALGRAVYAKTCLQCHTLFGDGGKVGPELTGSNRANLDYVLENIVDPSALISKDYVATTILLEDGKQIVGIVKKKDEKTWTVQTQNETLVIPTSDIEQHKESVKSMMPDDILKGLSEFEVQSLVAYLASPQQTPMLARADNVRGFFNGKDLTGWKGDPKLWRVENGEIIGSAPKGLDHNEFLKSEMLLRNFRLKFQTRLVGDKGNSGVQFRSIPFEKTEMQGYQADIGPDWWGKVYEEQARGLLWPKSGEEWVKKDQWNDYEIIANGNRVKTFINGHLCADFEDPAGRKEGVIGLQLHSGEPTEVRFRNFELDLNPPDLGKAETVIPEKGYRKK